ncbi:MAG: hypothetical protein Q7S48_01845 [bacterium]|nr:hypothetical protein [bacterium]
MAYAISITACEADVQPAHQSSSEMCHVQDYPTDLACGFLFFIYWIIFKLGTGFVTASENSVRNFRASYKKKAKAIPSSEELHMRIKV